MDNDTRQELGEVSASIYAALCKACTGMPSYPVGIVEPHLAALHKRAHDQGYYDGFTYLLTQHEALREALEAAPLIGRTESVNDFMVRQNAWLNGPYRAALEQSK
jgi:hypothetical protein